MSLLFTPGTQETDGLNAPAKAEVRAQLEHILTCPPFSTAERLSTFLSYVVTESLEGRAARLKQFTIGLDVFNRGEQFDPVKDPIVRIQAGRVRRALARYYSEAGTTDSIRIEIPVGSYAAVFSYAETSGTNTPTAHTAASAAIISPMPTIAVLPFVDQSYEPMQGYLINGMLEELSAELSRFPAISVIAYSSALQTAASDISPLSQARTMGADFALHGTVRADAHELRITLHLLNTVTGEKVWARRELKSLAEDAKPLADFRMLRRLASQIADTFGVVQRLHLESRAQEDRHSDSAFGAIMAFHQYTLAISPENFTSALGLLEGALQQEPGNAAVNAKLALLYLDAHAFGFDGAPADCREAGIRMARHARTLNPLSQQVHMTNAFAHLIEGDRDSLVRSAERIVEINPNAAYMSGAAAFFLATAGDYDRAEQLFKESLKLNPFYPTWFHFVPFVVAFQKKDYARALMEAREFAIPGFFWTHIAMTSALAKVGKLHAAAKELELLLESRPGIVVSARADVHLFTLDEQLANEILEALHEAGLPPPNNAIAIA
jgi:adenylate cyclase